MQFKVQKTHYFPHTVHYCCSSMLRLSETRQFLQISSFWEARRALIGQPSSALWLTEYLKMEMLRPLPYCDAVFRRHETKTIKPIINEAFVASSGDIITDYNDLYCLSRCIAPRKHYHVCICDRRNDNNLRYSTLWSTSVANSLNKKTYLQAVSQKHQTVLATLDLPHFIETAGRILPGSGNSPP